MLTLHSLRVVAEEHFLHKGLALEALPVRVCVRVMCVCLSCVCARVCAPAVSQSTVNDVLDLHAMTAGEFSLNRSPVIVYSSLLSVLKRCRSYLPQDVAFQYCLPLPQLCLQLDMRRLSQIITNAVRWGRGEVCVHARA